jgi:hypothetical protein
MSEQTLPEFLLARITEEQRHAEALAVTMASDSFTAPAELAMLGALVNPPRVLADCEAKRRIVTNATVYRERAAAETTESRRFIGEVMAETADDSLRALASIYADHPDCREEWRP